LKKKQIKKKKSEDKQSALADLLRKHGAQIYDDIDKGNFPKFTIPSRSVSNIVYDKKIRRGVSQGLSAHANQDRIFCYNRKW